MGLQLAIRSAAVFYSEKNCPLRLGMAFHVSRIRSALGGTESCNFANVAAIRDGVVERPDGVRTAGNAATVR